MLRLSRTALRRASTSNFLVDKTPSENAIPFTVVTKDVKWDVILTSFGHIFCGGAIWTSIAGGHTTFACLMTGMACAFTAYDVRDTGAMLRNACIESYRRGLDDARRPTPPS